MLPTCRTIVVIMVVIIIIPMACTLRTCRSTRRICSVFGSCGAAEAEDDAAPPLASGDGLRRRSSSVGRGLWRRRSSLLRQTSRSRCLESAPRAPPTIGSSARDSRLSAKFSLVVMAMIIITVA